MHRPNFRPAALHRDFDYCFSAPPSPSGLTDPKVQELAFLVALVCCSETARQLSPLLGVLGDQLQVDRGRAGGMAAGVGRALDGEPTHPAHLRGGRGWAVMGGEGVGQ